MTQAGIDILDVLNQPGTPAIEESKLFINPPQLDQYNTTDFKWVHDIQINTKYLEDLTRQFEAVDLSRLKNKKSLLLKIIEFIDLTTLSGDDTEAVVETLTLKAIQPLSEELKEKVLHQQANVHTAAVCVYPARVVDVIKVLDRENARDDVKVASVAAGFPSGQYLLETRLHEIELLAKQKVDEVDIVIQRSLVLNNQWPELFSEVKQMKEKCGEKIHMKTILAVGELKTSENIYCASMTAMFAGSDFIKTSTGKEKTNATIPAGIIMCSAIKHFHKLSGKKIGLKPAGGISTFEDSVRWIYLVLIMLGPDWLNKDLFRIGASSLLNNILQELEAL
ncbi:deoxyribose-phosphate aldolase [Diaphorina citri]|uniref:deoxyribose-phosphate aldolase n=1 Tax=Diaphorina citri TaxID=121845 RepID=A0A1S3DN39_DIACI|nr:deoxyribose-phosphate aldolase [Diaphorina citri]